MTAAGRFGAFLASTAVLFAAILIVVALRQPVAEGTATAPTDLVLKASPIADATSALATVGQEQTPIPSCADGFIHLATFDRADQTVEGESAAAEAVGIVRLTSISEGELNAPPRETPTLPSQFNRVFRIATFEALNVAKGDPQSLLALRVFGGRYGCDTWEISDYPDFIVGQDYLVFAQRLAGPDGKSVAELTAVSIWRINVDGFVETPVDGPMAPAEALDGVR